jgi:hypothetical protein
MNGPNNLQCHILVDLKGLPQTKHSNLMGAFAFYKEAKVL